MLHPLAVTEVSYNIASLENSDRARVSSLASRADMDTHDDQTLSLLYTSLPPSLRRGLPKVQSLRKTVLFYTGHSRRGLSQATSVTEYLETAEHDTPPPRYQSQLAEGTSAGVNDVSCITQSDGVSCHESGIDNKVAQLGLTLLGVAAEDTWRTRGERDLSRRMYIDGLAYLLRGLPEDITADEVAVINAALPNPLREREEGSRTIGSGVHEPATPPRSLLHRTTANSTLYAILALSVVLPYAQFAVEQAWQWERNHHVSERAFQQGSIVLQSAGSRISSVLAGVSGLTNEQLGRACCDAGIWLMKDVSGGTSEGIGMAVERLQLLGDKQIQQTLESRP
jgi:hypothetical protein